MQSEDTSWSILSLSSAVTVNSVKGACLSSNLAPSENMSDESCGPEGGLSKNAPNQLNWLKKKKFDSKEVNLLIWPFGTRTVKHGDFVATSRRTKI